jgi:hypothetical protein
MLAERYLDTPDREVPNDDSWLDPDNDALFTILSED